MSNISNLRIVTELGELIYKEVQDLNLSFNRIVDDYTDISNRFGDFSYNFNLPIVKENSKIFGAPESTGSKGFFVKNRNISCQVYNNNQLILDGVVNLESITKDTYRCKFYSKFKELIDSLNEKNPDGTARTLRNLNLPVISGWDYETSLKDHILADYKDSDETYYQYPLSFYSTFYCQASYYTGHTDIEGYLFDSDRTKQNYYYLLNNIASNYNRIYYHQIPPAIYIVPIVKQILADAGWNLGGQFFNDKNIKKILLLYAGDDDIYDQASQVYSGSTAIDLQLAKFLPDMAQADFLKGIINYFNLYFRIDTSNKIIEFETYNTYFRHTDGIDPYDITEKLDLSSSDNEISYFSTNNPSITFKKAQNQNIFGDNQVMYGPHTNSAKDTLWYAVPSTSYDQTFNRTGFIGDASTPNFYGSDVSKIEIPFSEPTVKKHYVFNDENIAGVNKNAAMQLFYLPLLSKQTPNDNNNVPFNKKDEDTYLFNDESTIKFQGDGSLMYYYGISHTDFVNEIGKGGLSEYLYFNMYISGVKYRIPIPITSPFQMLEYRDAIESWLDGVTDANVQDRRTTVASYLQSIWQMLGATTGVTSNQLTDFSLTFDDNGYFHETLWSKFHKYKWDRYQNSEVLKGTMAMNSYDWSEMQINRPLLYNKEIYSLVSIEGFNPITRTATLTLIKKL
jgi:hypothetical protein